MPLTDVQICANALVRLGAQPIQSFSDGTDIATFCDTIYSQKKAYLLGSYPWRFSMKYVQLSRLTESPVAQWEYQFALPSDRIRTGVPAIFTSTDANAPRLREYDIIGNKLMSNETTLYMQYQYDVDESEWPEYFTELMIQTMKMELCYLVTDSSTLYNEIKMETFGTPSEAGKGGLFAQTTFLDSRDTPTQFITDFSLINARYAGLGYGVDYTVDMS